MAKTNKCDFHDEDPEGGNESSNEQNSEEERKSDSPREESSEDEIEWNDEFRPVERDPAANIRPYMHLFRGFTVEELLSLMPITFKSYIESTRDPCSSCIYPPQHPGEVSRFLESWRNSFRSYGNFGSTSSSQRIDHSQDPQNQVPNSGKQTTDETESSGDQAASEGKKN